MSSNVSVTSIIPTHAPALLSGNGDQTANFKGFGVNPHEKPLRVNDIPFHLVHERPKIPGHLHSFPTIPCSAPDEFRVHQAIYGQTNVSLNVRQSLLLKELHSFLSQAQTKKREHSVSDNHNIMAVIT